MRTTKKKKQFKKNKKKIIDVILQVKISIISKNDNLIKIDE